MMGVQNVTQSCLVQGEHGLLNKLKDDGDVPATEALPEGRLDGKLESDGTSTDGTDNGEGAEARGPEDAARPLQQPALTVAGPHISPEARAAAVPLLSGSDAERDDPGTNILHRREVDPLTQDAAVPVLQPAKTGPGTPVFSAVHGAEELKITPAQPSANGTQPPTVQTLAARAPAGAVAASGQPGADLLQVRICT